MFNIIGKIFGRQNFEPLVKKINSFEPEFEKLSDEELKNKSFELKKLVQEGKELDEILPESFALAREASKRVLKQRHFDVQLVGGIILHQGKIAEMMTGEGKTLAATAPVYLNSLTGKGVHIITVNDYLARRDAIWMGQIYYSLGMSVGCLVHETAFIYDPEYKGAASQEDEKRDELGSFKVFQDFLRPVSRKEAYLTDIVYGTNHEFGFDYLRDNLAYDPSRQAQRGHYFAIIDEVDSILIDEARTPLIISGPDAESSEYYKVFARVVNRFKKDEDYIVDEKARSASITDEGINKVEETLGLKDIYDPQNFRLVHYLEESLKAKALFLKDKHYIVEKGEVVIIDEFTGRKMHGRRYSGGLHQAIEAREKVVCGENVEVKQETRTFAQITIQNYFRLYEKICGMTGTAQTSAEEFHKVYNLEVISVPSNKPVVRKDSPDAIYKNFEAKYRAIVEETRKRHMAGQPVLLGTASITNNELLSGLFKRAGIPHETLNAKNHEREGEIIAQAGRSGAVTVATNMAGRGVDIVLGGNPASPEEAQKVREAGGLHVIGAERHEARRIDNQLRGRSGRQGDSGSSRFFLSLEDDLLRIFGGDKIKSLMESFNLPEDQPIESSLVSRAVNEAQRKIEGLNFDLRKHLLEYDDVLNKQRTAFYKKRQDMLIAPQINVDETQINAENTNGSVSVQRESALNQRMSALGILDVLWMNHLDNLEALRESVGMRAYGQKEPLIEYRRDSHIMFKEMMANFDRWLQEFASAQNNAEQTQNNAEINTNNIQRISASGLRESAPNHKIGRNDPCPCGSKKEDGTSKKYKHCCGK
ncbi:MAG: preprotein translocase subunit SecA [Spirochaetota bacterium]